MKKFGIVSAAIAALALTATAASAETVVVRHGRPMHRHVVVVRHRHRPVVVVHHRHYRPDARIVVRH